VLRDPQNIVPNGSPIVRGPGPATGLILDLLCWIPAALALVRRLIDPQYAIRLARSFVPLGLLGIWAVASTFWSSDKFAAAVSAFHLLSAFVMLWAAAQLVRDWVHLRVVAATCVGLLLVLVVNSAIYTFVELPDLRKTFDEQADQIIREHGWEKDSFQARPVRTQGDRRRTGRLRGVPQYARGNGRHRSASSAPAVIIQRTSFRDDSGFAGIIGLAIAAGLWVIYYTHSRGAVITLALGAVILIALAVLRAKLAQRPRAAYLAGVVVVLLIAAAAIGHGLAHGSLFHESLTFRWKYWVGSSAAVPAAPADRRRLGELRQ
jgi:hypothetical protein